MNRVRLQCVLLLCHGPVLTSVGVSIAIRHRDPVPPPVPAHRRRVSQARRVGLALWCFVSELMFQPVDVSELMFQNLLPHRQGRFVACYGRHLCMRRRSGLQCQRMSIVWWRLAACMWMCQVVGTQPRQMMLACTCVGCQLQCSESGAAQDTWAPDLHPTCPQPRPQCSRSAVADLGI